VWDFFVYPTSNRSIQSGSYKAERNNPSKKKTKSEDEITAPLFEEIGRLKVQLDWLKKKSSEISF